MATEEEQAQLDNTLNIRRMGGADELQGMIGDSAKTADQTPKAETWKYTDGSTLAISGTANTSDLSSFLPFDFLTFTEDGGIATATWNIQIRPGNKAVVIISGSGTIEITGEVNSVTSGAITVSLLGVEQAATTLAAGTYLIEV